MADRVREALFGSLDAAGELDGAMVLDLYAGSGALGLEALSRGASGALFVEADRPAAAVLRSNVDAVGLGGTVRHGRAETVLAEPASTAFDLVLVAPPYALDSSRVIAPLATGAARGWFAAEALIIVERALRDTEPDWTSTFHRLRTKHYGDTALYWRVYRPVGELGHTTGG